MSFRIAVAVAGLAACAHPPHSARPLDDAPAVRPADQTRHYTVWLGGARVGTAVESERWTSRGVTLRRTETMRFLRGDAPITLVTTIVIDANAALVPSSMSWTEDGPALRRADAIRQGGRWTIRAGDRDGNLDRGELVTLPDDAVPAELMPLLTRRDGHFAGRVFLPARGFLLGHGRVEPAAPGRLVARLALDGGAVAEATIDIDREGVYTRIVDGEGVIASQVSAVLAAEPFEPVDLIAATAIPITGPRAGSLVIDGDMALPPVPGQQARPARTGIELSLSSKLPGALPDEARGPDRSGEIRHLVAAVRASIVPDLATGPTTAKQAAAATAGDCTTFALAYAAHAARRAIPTRVVTGLRVDGDRLIRHRWAVSWTGRTWIAVDAAFGAAPAGGDLIGLAVHDADDAGLVAGEAALAMVRSASRH